jgi:hypothetical protein
MSPLAQHILSQAQSLPEGGLLSPKDFLHLGSRAAVDQTLSRLARDGKLLRLGRGAYAVPVQGRFGVRPPTSASVVQAIESASGETVVASGAAETMTAAENVPTILSGSYFDLPLSDFNDHVRPFRIGIVSKCYPDGRKNENWLIKFAKDGILSNCEFAVVGEGWEETIANLRVMGIPCEIFSKSNGNAIPYEEIKSFLKQSDKENNKQKMKNMIEEAENQLTILTEKIRNEVNHIEFNIC